MSISNHLALPARAIVDMLQIVSESCPTKIFLANPVAVTAIPAIAQDASARTVQYHSQDIAPIHAKLKYTTLIEVPPTEKIMEAATGDKDFWVVDVVGNFCFVHPARSQRRSAKEYEARDVSGAAALAIYTTKLPVLGKEGFWKMAHAALLDYAMLFGLISILMAPGAGTWSLDE